MPASTKPYHCVMCGEEDPSSFTARKSLCRKCNRKRDYTTHAKILLPHLCKMCGDSDMINFYKGSKSTCKTCHAKNCRPRKSCLFTPNNEVKINIIKKEV